jgi:hypothetical protein
MMFKPAIAIVFIGMCAPAFAHLTWVEPGQNSMGLSTGHHFPAKELTVVGRYVESITCEGQASNTFKLQFNERSIRYPYPEQANNCVAVLKTTQIELTPRQGVQHFEESKASAELIAKARQSSTFLEQYFKVAQMKPVELTGPLYNPDMAQFVSKADKPDAIYLYRNGKPLAGVSVGLEYPEAPVTLWSSTQADGEVKLLLRPNGKALLRALVVEDVGQQFESQFVSVLLEP